MKQLSNPFVIGKYVNKEYFCDRVKESETLVHHIENGRNVTITGIPEILAICEGGGVSKQRWRDTLIERQRIIDEVIDPFYKNDYQRFARVNNEMLDDFIVLSHFQKFFPFLKLLTKMAKFFNDKFKHIPIE